MSAEKGSTNNLGIHIPVTTMSKSYTTTCVKPIDVTDVKTGGEVPTPLRKKIENICKFYVEDIDRLIFPFKVGLAVVLVSLLILVRAPYEIFGTNVIWCILTTALMFEYTVGMTLNRGFNRGLGSCIAGILAIALAQIGVLAGGVAEPIMIGGGIFFVGVITSLLKIWPSLVPYEYAFRVTLFTFCLIIVSGYRMGNPIGVSMDRLYTVAIGGLVAVLVNVLVFPIWAGEQLHKEVSSSFDAVADLLEECVRKYLEVEGSEKEGFTRTIVDEYPDEPAYKKCRNTLNSSAKLQTLANAAKWEPPHGRFRQFFYPWSEYLKVSSVLRHCAYEVMALHGVLHSEIRASCKLRLTFKQELRDSTNQAADLVRSLGKDISNMKRNLSTNTALLERTHTSTNKLQCAISNHLWDLMTQSEPIEKKDDPKAQSPLLMVSYHEMLIKKFAKQNSCPLIEVDHQGDDHHVKHPAVVRVIPRMRALESTAALSVATFASLLIEFVARLDHLVEAVDELARMAKFSQKAINPIDV